MSCLQCGEPISELVQERYCFFCTPETEGSLRDRDVLTDTDDVSARAVVNPFVGISINDADA